MLNTTRREIYRKRVTSVRSISVVRTKSPLISRTNRRLCAAVLHLDGRISLLLLRNARQLHQYVHQVPNERARYASLYRDKTRPRKTGRSINTPSLCVWKGIETPFDEILLAFSPRRGYGNSCFQVRSYGRGLYIAIEKSRKEGEEREREKIER